MSVVCPICGYNQGEERILVSHLVGVHGGIPHTPGEELFVCHNHPHIQPMNHLEFIKHSQEVSSNVGYGQPKSPACQPVKVLQGQVPSVPLTQWREMATKDSGRAEKWLRARTARYVIVAIFLLGLAIFNLVTYTSVLSDQSTFTLQPGLAYDLPFRLTPTDSISVTFHENSGNLVSLYILTSAQFASYQAKNPFTYLYSVTNVASGGYSFTATVQDTYYLFFDHGSGLANNAETVFALRNYTTHDIYRLVVGIFLVAAAVADFYVAYRINRRAVRTAEKLPSFTGSQAPS